MSYDDASYLIELGGDWKASAYPDGPTMDGKLPALAAPEWFEVEVPGAVQYDLIRIGKLSNPYASSRAVQNAEWVHQSDWVFTRTFDFDMAAAESGAVYLDVDGIDTFAEIWLNGTSIGTTANAYRSYRFAIDAGLLKPEGNSLVIHVKAHKRMVEHMVPEAKKRLGPSFKYKNLIRRYQRSFFAGSSLLNLGGEVLGIGIYKAMRIVVVPPVRIDDAYFETTAIGKGKATAEVAVTLSHKPAEAAFLRARLIDPESGTIAAAAEAEVQATGQTVALAVDNPKLWWPRGYGAQDRYRLEVELVSGETVLSRTAKKVGIRTSTILKEKPSGRPTFEIVINGTHVHARGHNVIPVDYIKVHGPKEAYERLMRMVCDSNSNIVRIWGGGGIESEEFFDMCDEMGILIWQDFYLHSTTYPDYDADWVAEYRTECEELLKRLRSRPCLAVVCGGNEQYEGWDEWGWRGQLDRFYGEMLFTEVGKEVAEKMTPALPYVLNSPHGGGSCQAPATGEAHNWGNFYNSTKDPLLVTETCWSQESYSRAETLEKMMDLDLADYAEIGWPEKWAETTGRPLVTRLPYTGGPLVMRSLEAYLKCLEIEQAFADHHALSNLLVRSPSCNGLIYWPLNKGGPLFQFGCVDYLGYPLASYYVVKRLFADVVLTIYRDISDIRVIAVNRSGTPVSGTLLISHQRANGDIVGQWEKEITIDAYGRGRFADLDGYYDNIVDRNAEVVKASFVVDGEMMSEETLFFTPLMEFAVKPETIRAKVSKIGDDRWELDVSADSVVKLFYAEGNQKFLLSDNYITLTPDEPRRITVDILERTSEEAPVLRLYAMDSDEIKTIALA